MTHGITWKNLEDTLGEVGQSKETVPRVIKSIQTESGNLLTGVKGERVGSSCLMVTKFQLGKMLEKDRESPTTL